MTMKTIQILLVGGLLAGCQGYLDEEPRGQIVGTNAITSVEGLDAALTGSYKGLTTTWVTGINTPALQALTMGSDDITTHPAANKQDFREMDQFNVTAQNGRTATVWNGCYKTIQGANNIINNYQKVTGNPAKIDPIVGEAYFIRALSYYWLVRVWGNIPLITTAEFSPDLFTVKKNTPAEVYALIEADLLKAEQMVINTKRDPGRPNKGSVKALLADVYLTEGGWPINNPAKYALAATKAKEVIDNRAIYGFGLFADLAVLWSGSSAGANTSEDVLSLATTETQWFAANAIYGSAATPGEETGWDDYFAEITFYNNFPAGKRKDLTFYTTFKKDDGTTLAWQQSQTKHPYYRKCRLQVNNTYQSSLPVPLIRYAHVLLIYAEAQARSGAPTAEAYTALNAVRSRAGLAPLSGLTAPAFANAVVSERSWEFAAEWTRWFDLLRLEKVEEANATKAADDLKPIKAITKANYWLPIPLADVNLNPNLK
jgi:starch-binding outer membrane protein, SusD/RagB family